MATKTPWHIWVVGILAVLWNSVGAFDYVMTQSQNEAYMSGFSQVQLDYFYAQPIWVVCAWAIAIWSSVAASILLLMRNALSATVFLVSFIGVVITTIYNYGLSNGYEVMGGAGALAFAALILTIALALYFYSRVMTQRGILN